MMTNNTRTRAGEGSPRTKRLAVATAAAVPALMLALAGPANAAELTPIAEAVDGTVADTLSTVGDVLDAAGLEGED